VLFLKCTNPLVLIAFCPPLLFTLVGLVALLLELNLCGMLSPHLIDEDPFSSYELSLEVLAAFDFGGAFGFDRNGDSSLFSFGLYNNLVQFAKNMSLTLACIHGRVSGPIKMTTAVGAVANANS
jgi:hypothetical protein